MKAENLRQLVNGRELNAYQRALAKQEFENLEAYAKQTEPSGIKTTPNASDFFDGIYTIHLNDYVRMPKTELFELMENFAKAKQSNLVSEDRIPESNVIKEKAHEMDEKEFEHWWWETVYKGN